MANTEVKELLDAGVHFGHLTRKWNPNMAPYIYMERNGIHIINLYKTAAKLNDAVNAIKKIVLSGRKAVKKMNAIDRMKSDGTFETLSKREKLQVDRQRAKLEKNLGSISDMTRLPGAIFVVDTLNEKISVQEAQKLKIPIFAMVDTNSDPIDVDFIIPSNDDASKSIEKILDIVCNGIQESLDERKKEKEIAEQKMKDLNANSIDQAAKIIEGSARSMGFEVVE